MTSKKTDSDITKSDGDAVKSGGDIELAETGTAEGQTNPLRPTKSMYRAANENEVKRILEAYNNHKAFLLRVSTGCASSSQRKTTSARGVEQ